MGAAVISAEIVYRIHAVYGKPCCSPTTCPTMCTSLETLFFSVADLVPHSPLPESFRVKARAG